MNFDNEIEEQEMPQKKGGFKKFLKYTGFTIASTYLCKIPYKLLYFN